MLKTATAVTTAAIVAACFVAFPGLSPQVEAESPALSGKSDRADTRPLAVDCSQRAWPYFEATCLRDTRHASGEARQVRFVPLDALPAADGNSRIAIR